MTDKIGKYSRITGTDRETLSGEVVEMYEDQTLSIREITEATGRSYGAIHRLLTEANVAFRPRGSRPARS